MEYQIEISNKLNEKRNNLDISDAEILEIETEADSKAMISLEKKNPTTSLPKMLPPRMKK